MPVPSRHHAGESIMEGAAFLMRGANAASRGAAATLRHAEKGKETARKHYQASYRELGEITGFSLVFPSPRDVSAWTAPLFRAFGLN